jgi:hypothetical protein
MRSAKFYNNVFAVTTSAVIITLISVYLISGKSFTPFPMYPAFSDLIIITSSVDCSRAGFDPYVDTHFDPWNRFYNYPKLWLTVFDFFGITRKASNPVGIGMILLFYVSTLPLFKIKSWAQLLCVSAFIFSSPILLLLERGNCDILLYLLILFSTYYLRKINFFSDSIKLHISYLIILFAAMLKIYPIFIMPLLFFEKLSRKHLYLILLYSAVILTVYFARTYDNLLFVSKNTPRATVYSFGKNVYLQHIFKGASLAVLANGLLAAVVFGAFYIVDKYRPVLLEGLKPSFYIDKKNVLIFLAGGLTYMGTFFLGNNWDYRLVFLILTFPFLKDLYESMKNNLWRNAMLGVFLFGFYSGFLTNFEIVRKLHLYVVLFTMEQLSQWLIMLIITIIVLLIYRDKLLYRDLQRAPVVN